MAFSRWFKSRTTVSKNRLPKTLPKPLRASGPEAMEERFAPTTWLGNTTGTQNWSNAAQWNTGVPTASNNASLLFLNNVAAGYTASNDLSNFILNSMDFNGRYGYVNQANASLVTGATVGGTGPTFSSGGGSASITQSGSAAASVNFASFNFLAPLTVGGFGSGNLIITGTPVPPGGGGNSNSVINFNRSTYNNYSGYDYLNAASNSPTQIKLTGGNAVLGAAVSGQPISVTSSFSSGSLSYSPTTFGTFFSAGDYAISGTLNIGGVGNATINGQISGSGNLALKPLVPITYTLNNSDTQTGNITAGTSQLSAIGATLRLANNNALSIGTITSANSLNADNGGTIQIDNSNLPSTNTQPDRIGDSIPLNLNSGSKFDYIPYSTNTANFVSTETLGSLSPTGNATVAIEGKINGTHGNDGTLTFSNYSNFRSYDTVYFQGQNLGGPVTSTTSDRILFTNANSLTQYLVGGGGMPNTQNISVLQNGYGTDPNVTNNGAGNTLVTYTATTGIRPLALASSVSSGEYNTNYTGGNSPTNVRFIKPVTISVTPSIINSLVLDTNAGVWGRVLGSAPLTITSDVILAASTGNSDVNSALRDRIDSPVLIFGTNNGSFNQAGRFIVPGSLTVMSALSGASGYIKSGSGDLSLQGNNASLTGSVYLTGGNTIVSSINTNLGGTGTIMLDGGTLTYSGGGETVSRNISVGSGTGTIALSTIGAKLNLSGSLSTSSETHFQGNGTIELSGSNGGSTVDVATGTTLQVDNSNALPTGAINLASGSTLSLPAATNVFTTINIEAGTTNSGSPNPLASATINNAKAITVNRIDYIGDINSSYGLNKTGTGDLTLNGFQETFNGPLDIQQGRVILSSGTSMAALNSAGDGVVIESGGTLVGSGDTMRDVNVKSGGTLSAYTGTGTAASILKTNGITGNPGGIVTAYVNGTFAGSGSGYSQLDATGAINLNGATLNVVPTTAPTIGAVYTIIKNELNNPVVGTFNGLAEGANVVTGFGVFRISYLGGAGKNDVTLTGLTNVVPTLPNLTAINYGNPLTSPTAASQVTFNVVFDKAVTGVSSANFTIVGTAAGSASFGTISTANGGSIWQVTIIGLASVNGTIGLNLTSNAGIFDASNNPLATTNFTGQVYVIDHSNVVVPDTTPPTLLSINIGTPPTAVTNANQVTFNVGFSEQVLGVMTANFTMVGSAAPFATFKSITSTDGGVTWQASVSGLGAINGTIGLNLTSATGIKDLAGNLLSTTALTGAVYTIDHTPPSTSLTLAPGQSSSTNAAPISFAVSFSKPVTGFTTAGLTLNGVVKPNNVTISGSGTDYIVTVNRVTAAGAVTLKVNSGAASDAAGNLSAASGPATVTYTPPSQFAVGAGPGIGPDVRVYNSATGALNFNFFAYDARFQGGVSVATGDFNGDGVADIVTGSGFGAGPHVKVFDGTNGQQLPGYSFYAYDPAYTGGINVAAGDLNHDGIPDIIVGTKPGSEPHVVVLDGLSLQSGVVKQIASFYAFDQRFLGGLSVAAADVEGLGYDDLIVTPASGNSPHVEVFHLDGSGGYSLIQSYIAGVPGVNFGANGLSVSGGISAAGSKADIVLGDMVNGVVAIYDGGTSTLKQAFQGFEPGVTNVGARVASIDTNNDGIADTILVASGPTAYPRIRRFDSVTANIKDAFFVNDPAFLGGVFVG